MASATALAMALATASAMVAATSLPVCLHFEGGPRWHTMATSQGRLCQSRGSSHDGNSGVANSRNFRRHGSSLLVNLVVALWHFFAYT
jgi:hypothetical protein